MTSVQILPGTYVNYSKISYAWLKNDKTTTVPKIIAKICRSQSVFSSNPRGSSLKYLQDVTHIAVKS